MELSDLVPLLAKYRVKRFKDGSIEIDFESAALEKKQDQDQVPSKPAWPNHMPEELKDPDTMTADQILNWSGSPEPENPAAVVPLTGEAPLSDA